MDEVEGDPPAARGDGFAPQSDQLTFAAFGDEVWEGGAGGGSAEKDAGGSATPDPLVREDAEDASFADEVGQAQRGVLLSKEDKPPFLAAPFDDSVDQAVVQWAIVGAD